MWIILMHINCIVRNIYLTNYHKYGKSILLWVGVLPWSTLTVATMNHDDDVCDFVLISCVFSQTIHVPTMTYCRLIIACCLVLPPIRRYATDIYRLVGTVWCPHLRAMICPQRVSNLANVELIFRYGLMVSIWCHSGTFITNTIIYGLKYFLWN